MKVPRSAPLLIVGALFLFCSGVWSVVYAETPHSSGILTFAVLDIGQGDALYIESPAGVQVVVDGGPDDSLLRALPAVMPALDRSLDAIIETHPDADHIGGFSGLMLAIAPAQAAEFRLGSLVFQSCTLGKDRPEAINAWCRQHEVAEDPTQPDGRRSRRRRC